MTATILISNNYTVYHAVSLEEKQNIIVDKPKELNLKVTEAKAERLSLEADAAAIREGRATAPEALLKLAGIAAVPDRLEVPDRDLACSGRGGDLPPCLA